MRLALFVFVWCLAHAHVAAAQWITDPAAIDSVLSSIRWTAVEQQDLGSAATRAIVSDRRAREDAADRDTVIAAISPYAALLGWDPIHTLDVIGYRLSTERDSAFSLELSRRGVPQSARAAIIEAGRRIRSRDSARPRRYALVVSSHDGRPLLLLALGGTLERRRIVAVLSDDIVGLVTRLALDSLEAARLDRFLELDGAPSRGVGSRSHVVFRASDSLAATIRPRALRRELARDREILGRFAASLGLRRALVDSLGQWAVRIASSTDLTPDRFRRRLALQLEETDGTIDTASLRATLLDSIHALARAMVTREYAFPSRFYLVARRHDALALALLGTTADFDLRWVELFPDGALLEELGLTAHPIQLRSPAESDLLNVFDVIDGLEGCACPELLYAIRKREASSW